MKRLWLLIPLGSLLTACLNSTVRGYTAQAMPGLTSPFTTNCTALRLVLDEFDGTLEQSEAMRVFTSHPNPGTTTITAYCLAMKDGMLTATGFSQINVKANTLRVYIGSGDDSTAAMAFAKTASVGGVFPIIRAE